MTNTRVHIISFDVPYPANYGGVIDVYHKIRCLKKQGVDVILHCFEYGRGEQEKLKELALEVHYYKRSTSILQQFSKIPYIVKSRITHELNERLLQDNFPILMEGLHTTGILLDKRFAQRHTIFRESNIEHDYYRGLAKAERNWIKKCFFLLEARKLKSYEKHLAKAQHMLIVSQEDTSYFERQFPTNKVSYLPSFHANDALNVSTASDKDPYILFHGNLSVQENVEAYYSLANAGVFELPFQFIVAGLHPSEALIKDISAKPNVQLVNSPDEDAMTELIQQAHIHLLFTNQPTGLKLKLINVLYAGKFIVCNPHMLAGTGELKQLVSVAQTPPDFKQLIKDLMHKLFNEDELLKRKECLIPFDNEQKTLQLISIINT
ncbi:MAG: hypothetical protein RI922_2195 [Bacteroidota bacterium]